MKTYSKFVLKAGLIFIIVLGAFFLYISFKEKEILEAYASGVTKQYTYLQQKLKGTINLAYALKKDLEAQKEKENETEAKIKKLEKELLEAKNEKYGLDDGLIKIKDLREWSIADSKVGEGFREVKKDEELPSGKKVARLKASLRKKNKELSELKKKLKILEKTYSNLGRENESLKTKLNKFKPQEKELQDQMEEARTELLTQGKKIEEQESKLKELSAAEEKLKTQASQLSQILVKKEIELNALTEERKKLKEEISVLQVEQADLKDQLNTARIEQEKAAALLGEISHFNSALEEKLGQLSQSRKEKEEAEKLKQKIEGEFKREVEVILEHHDAF